MKQVLLLFIISISTLWARDSKIFLGHSGISIESMLQRTDIEKPLLDSVWEYDWNKTKQRYDTSLTIVDFWIEKTGQAIGAMVYAVKGGLKYFDTRANVTVETKGNAKLYTQTVQLWDTLGKEWVNDIKRIYIVSDISINDTVIEYSWEKDQWKPLYKQGEYLNSDSSNITIYHWDFKSNVWRGDRRYVSNKNTRGQELLGIAYNWDTISHSFLPDYRLEYVYNKRNQLISYLHFDYVPNLENWKLSQRIVSVFDNTGTMSMDTTFEYTNNNLTSRKIQKSLYEYDKYDNPHIQKVYYYDETSDIYNYSRKVEFNYNIDHQLLFKLERRIQGIDTINVYKYEYTYDQFGNLTLDSEYEWDLAKGIWKTKGFSSKYEYQYDEYGNELLNMRSSWDTATDSWRIISIDKNIYSFHTAVSLNDPLTEDLVFLSPNPAIENITLNLDQVFLYEIMDSRGLRIKTGSAKSIDISNLQEGTYLIKTHTDNKVFSQKFIKKQ